jgi:hypothetical protein
MPSVPPSPLLVIFGVTYAVCAVGLLCSRVAAGHKADRSLERAGEIAAETRPVAEVQRPVVGAGIDAAFDRLAARRGVPRDQVTRGMVDKQFRRDVRRTWSVNLAKASHPRPGYDPDAIEALRQ